MLDERLKKRRWWVVLLLWCILNSENKSEFKEGAG
jgi:hypothetical protein